jgi:hypothetical protein
MTSVVIVEKNGDLKESKIKNIQSDMLYKKCGFKNDNSFDMKTCWRVRLNGEMHIIHLYAKSEGRANTENKFDFPPPIDSDLFFGNCLLARVDDSNSFLDFSLEMWKNVYEKLFGGFEDLNATAAEDELETDELADVADELKTNEGYLKDGFVVDDEIENGDSSTTESLLVSDDGDTEDTEVESNGSELFEECYVYSDED